MIYDHFFLNIEEAHHNKETYWEKCMESWTIVEVTKVTKSMYKTNNLVVAAPPQRRPDLTAPSPTCWSPGDTQSVWRCARKTRRPLFAPLPFFFLFSSRSSPGLIVNSSITAQWFSTTRGSLTPPVSYMSVQMPTMRFNGALWKPFILRKLTADCLVCRVWK